MGLGCPLGGRWYNRGAAWVLLVVGPVLPLGGRWYNRGAAWVLLVVGPVLGAAVGLAVPVPWALPGAERGQAG